MNTITQIAVSAGRNYITPEDVTAALQAHAVEAVRCDVLEVIGKQTEFGVEDYSLCAFIAYRGT